jgi:hypothetical protein
LLALDSGIVVSDVQRAELIDGALHGRFNLGLLAHVATHEEGAPVLAADRRRQLPVCDLHIRKHHGIAFSGERPRRRRTNP